MLSQLPPYHRQRRYEEFQPRRAGPLLQQNASRFASRFLAPCHMQTKPPPNSSTRAVRGKKEGKNALLQQRFRVSERDGERDSASALVESSSLSTFSIILLLRYVPLGATRYTLIPVPGVEILPLRRAVARVCSSTYLYLLDTVWQPYSPRPFGLSKSYRHVPGTHLALSSIVSTRAAQVAPSCCYRTGPLCVVPRRFRPGARSPSFAALEQPGGTVRYFALSRPWVPVQSQA